MNAENKNLQILAAGSIESDDTVPNEIMLDVGISHYPIAITFRLSSQS